MSVAVVFPGQGSQRKGMGRNLFDRFDDIVREADQILGYSVKELCLKDPDQQLGLTQYTQPALFTINAMSWEALKEDGAALPDYFAGHSLGEYNALVAAGAISFSSGLNLVKKRGELMARAKNGGMAAIIGPGEDQIRECLDKNKIKNVSVANLNTPSQTVISGSKAGIEAAKPIFDALAKTRYVILNVSGAFHAPPMADAAREFKAYMDEFEIENLKTPVISNVLARPYPKGETRELLCAQMTAPVRWMDSIRYMSDQGVKEFIEAGPGKVLTNMLKSILV